MSANGSATTHTQASKTQHLANVLDGPVPKLRQNTHEETGTEHATNGFHNASIRHWNQHAAEKNRAKSRLCVRSTRGSHCSSLSSLSRSSCVSHCAKAIVNNENEGNRDAMP